MRNWEEVVREEGLETVLALEVLCRGLCAALTPQQLAASPAVAAALPAAWQVLQDALPTGTVAGKAGPSDVACPVEPLCDWLALSTADRVRATHAVFGITAAGACPPLEGEYLAAKDPVRRSQHLADCAGFYRAAGLMPTSAESGRQDHVSLQLDFLAATAARARNLSAKGALPPAVEAVDTLWKMRVLFLRDHCLWWIGEFGRRVHLAASVLARSAGPEIAVAAGHLAGIGRITQRWVEMEAGLAGLELPPALYRPEPAEKPDEEETAEFTCATCAMREAEPTGAEE